mgnify:CR=1 FL=1
MATIRQTNKSITKRLTRIENALKSKLNGFYKRKIKPQAAITPIETFRQKYEQQVKTLIRKAIQEAYLTGTDIVAEKITDKNNEFVPFISVTDIQNIQQLTEKMSNQFWTTTEKLVRREQEFILDNASKELIKKKSFDDEAAIIGLSALFAYSGFNAAVLSKMQNIIPLQQAIPIAQTIPPSIDLEVGFDIQQLDPFNLPLEGQVMFLTQEDANVDPEICEPENRTIWDVNDPSLPVPPLHRHCRCRLIPLVEPLVDVTNI